MTKFLPLAAIAGLLIASSAPGLAETPGHQMQSKFSPHQRGTHHGASAFTKSTPGHQMQSKFSPHQRGIHHGASGFAR